MSQIERIISPWIFIVLPLLFNACSGLKDTHPGIYGDRSNCNQQMTSTYPANELPVPTHHLPIDTVLTNRFSFQSLNTANAIGILDLLTQFVLLTKSNENQMQVEKRVEVVNLLQRINQRIQIASLEISAVAGEMDCEEERADQIAAYLKGKEDDAETQLTVGAIVVGAAGAISAGALLANEDAGSTAEFIGVGAGLAEATLGTLILFNKRKVHFYHIRNALGEIWYGPDVSAVFPTPVWYYLTYKNPAIEGRSLREQLADNWLEFGQIAELKKHQREQVYRLFFGEGGRYTADQLSNRANMYDQVEACVNLMKQDLKILALEIQKLSER